MEPSLTHYIHCPTHRLLLYPTHKAIFLSPLKIFGFVGKHLSGFVYKYFYGASLYVDGLDLDRLQNPIEANTKKPLTL